MEEYGNPEEKNFQPALSQLSPLNSLQKNKKYPPALITADMNDDRVHPAHALKIFARLQEIGAEANFYLMHGAHSGQSTQNNQADDAAIIFSFLYRQIERSL